MIKFLLKYLISLFLFILVAILLLDYILLPSYVGYNNEKYLPDLRNEFQEKAIYKLTELGFNSNIIKVPYSQEHQSGTVIKMFPRPFTKVKVGSNIDLTVAGKDQDVIIPNIRFMTLRNAKINIAKLGLAIDTIIYEYDNSIKKGSITFHVPKYNQIVKSSSKLILGVSKGPPPDYYVVPNVINLSFNKAKLHILNIGLRIGDINYVYEPDFLPNTVIEQGMTPGMRVSFPAAINLIISKTKKD